MQAISVRKTDAEVSQFIEWFFDRQGEEHDEAGEDVFEAQPEDDLGARRAELSEAGDSEEDYDSELDDDRIDNGRLSSEHKKHETVFLDLAPSEEDNENLDDEIEEDDDGIDPIECSSDDDDLIPTHRNNAKRKSILLVSNKSAAKKTQNQQPGSINQFLVQLPPPKRPRSAEKHTNQGYLRQNQTIASISHGYSDRPSTIEEEALDDLDFANKMVFGNAAFRPRQRAIVEAALAGKDVFVLMPTGGGKSLCYQLPAVLTKGVTVVITPLLSLMQDQVQALCSLPGGGVPASYLSSQQTSSEAHAVHAELSKPHPSMKLLYVTPEQLVQGQRLREKLTALNARGLLSRVVVDECHCVSQWGHDFRKEYQQIGRVRNEAFPGVPVMALTATATSNVQQDVLSSLRMRTARQFSVSFFRDNLTFRVVPKDYSVDKESKRPTWETQLVDFIKNRPEETGIVYCLSRDDAESTAAIIRQSAGVSAKHYHAGLTPKQRTEVQNSWRSGEIKVVSATIAFGMGIDHATVRYVLHATMSKSLEGYYQEAGRAGRDGNPAECILFYGKRDGPRLLNLMRKGKKKGGSSFAREVEAFNAMTEFCRTETACRHTQILGYFGEEWQRQQCGNLCDVCRGEVVPLATVEGKPRGSRAGGEASGSRVAKPLPLGNNAISAAKKKKEAEKNSSAPPLSLMFTSAAAALRQNQSSASGARGSGQPSTGGGKPQSGNGNGSGRSTKTGTAPPIPSVTNAQQARQNTLLMCVQRAQERKMQQQQP